MKCLVNLQTQTASPRAKALLCSPKLKALPEGQQTNFSDFWMSWMSKLSRQRLIVCSIFKPQIPDISFENTKEEMTSVPARKLTSQASYIPSAFLPRRQEIGNVLTTWQPNPSALAHHTSQCLMRHINIIIIITITIIITIITTIIIIIIIIIKSGIQPPDSKSKTSKPISPY